MKRTDICTSGSGKTTADLFQRSGQRAPQHRNVINAAKAAGVNLSLIPACYMQIPPRSASPMTHRDGENVG